MNVFNHGIESIDLVFNQVDDREKIENVQIDKDTGANKLRGFQANKRKIKMREYIEENGKFLKFKLSTTAVGGRANLED